MIDLYLKTSTKGVMTKLLKTAELVDAEGNLTAGVSLDIIGTITRVTGLDADGLPITETVPGWHANLRGDFSEAVLASLAAYNLPAPATPYRVWA